MMGYLVEDQRYVDKSLTFLSQKPPCYMTDSDCTYGGGDDGISSGGSEVHRQVNHFLKSETSLSYD